MTAKKISLAVAGADGRMGREVLSAAAADAAFEVALAFERAGHPAVGSAAAAWGSPIQSDDALQSQDGIQVLIDFTTPAGTLAFAEVCRQRGIGMVVGSTGFSAAQWQALQAAGADIPILVAQNMSIGVNAMYRIAEFAATTLNAGRLGGGYDIEVSEEHHRHKKDAPSGTALRLGQVLAGATGASFEADAAFARHGAEAKRGEHDIGFSVLRAGDIVGTHRVVFAGSGEQIEVIHRSSSRANYAAGALHAAKFIAAAPVGFYDGISAIS